MGWVWSQHVESLFVSSLEMDGFDQHELRYILCPCQHFVFLFALDEFILGTRWHGRVLVNAFWDAFMFSLE